MKLVRLGILILLLVLVWVWRQYPDGKLHVVFCNVGQGDASLVTKGSFQMLIDAGPKGEDVLACLAKQMPFWDRRIEVVINTHADMDHIGGLGAVMERYWVERLVVNGEYGGNPGVEQVREAINKSEIMIDLPCQGDVVRYRELTFDILWPEDHQGSVLAWMEEEEKVLGAKAKLNQASVVGKLSFGEFEVLFAGDISKEQEEVLVKERWLEEVEILKVAHHGSKFSSSEEFLAEVVPREAVIMVGRNSFGHPTGEVLERLQAVGARVWRTDKDGEVEFVTDGRKYWVKK